VLIAVRTSNPTYFLFLTTSFEVASSKKRKVDNLPKEKWKNDFFVPVKDNLVCLICKEIAAVLIEFYMEIYYSTKHSQYKILKAN
jgi:hypothetical protein